MEDFACGPRLRKHNILMTKIIIHIHSFNATLTLTNKRRSTVDHVRLSTPQDQI